MWGKVAGSVTRQKSCPRLAPRERAARMMAGVGHLDAVKGADDGGKQRSIGDDENLGTLPHPEHQDGEGNPRNLGYLPKYVHERFERLADDSDLTHEQTDQDAHDGAQKEPLGDTNHRGNDVVKKLTPFRTFDSGLDGHPGRRQDERVHQFEGDGELPKDDKPRHRDGGYSKAA